MACRCAYVINIILSRVVLGSFGAFSVTLTLYLDYSYDLILYVLVQTNKRSRSPVSFRYESYTPTLLLAMVL